jgi:hypothetical protein
MVMEYNQFKPILEEIAGCFPFGGKPLGTGAWLLLAAGVRVAVLGWLGVRGLFVADSVSAE